MYNEDIKDVDFTDIQDDKIIRGEVLYFSTGQVATMLGESDSKIRFYTKTFEDILHIEVSNKQRRYKKSDIDKLKYLIELKNEKKLTIKQIQEFCKDAKYDGENGLQAVESNPLSIQTLSKALMDEQLKQFQLLKEELSQKIETQIIDITKLHLEHNANLKNDMVEEMAITINECIEEHLKSEFTDTNNTISELQETIKNQSEKLEEVSEYFRVATISKESLYKKPSKFQKIADKFTDIFLRE